MSTTKELLTPTGIGNKLTALYALSDAVLKDQAILIRDDFRNWMNNNFLLTTDQENYMDGFSIGYEDFLSDMLYIAVKNRRPVTYTPIDPTITPWASKVLPIFNTFEWEFGSDLSLKGEISIPANT